MWYLVAFLAPFLIMFVGFCVDALLLGGSAPEPSRFQWLSLPFVFVSVFVSYVWEEIGWRGFALPRLQERYNALASSLIMGTLAFLWHLPLSLNKDIPTYQIPLLAQLVFDLGIAIWFTWLYNNALGSVLIASIFHASLNVTAAVAMSIVGESGFVRQYAPIAIVYLVTAICIAFVYGAKSLSRRDVSETISVWAA